MQAGREFDGAPLGLKVREMRNQAQIAAEKDATVMIVPAGLDVGVGRAMVGLSGILEGGRGEEGSGWGVRGW